MTVFGAYARYYDLLYRDKNYAGEAAHVDSLLRAHGKAPRTLLELGCGTGGHAFELAKRGYSIHGVDLSEDMLTAARQRLERTPHAELAFSEGDARSCRIGSTFDAVISLFHVLSYHQTNADQAAAFATARTHLKPGGVFVFDCWYGPAVLTDRPVVRVRRLEDDRTHVTRIAEPVMHATENIVDVNYHVFLRDKASGEQTEITEQHRMRYLFSPEIEAIASQARFELVYRGEWMTGQPLSFSTWGACFVARAI
ncbi:MAG TPA: class I SAM-dependent methyltransferase [Kofleriaceae bacterium]|nr:class I SAM-dependent methyltransferase [Kofleriaceae bacterium]